MTKNEFMTRLTTELRKRNVADSGDVLEEYEQHFAFKLSDGYSEEEISARLGDPAALAAQFSENGAPRQKNAGKPFVIAGLCFADLLGGMVYLLLAAWELVMAAAGVACMGSAVCLIGGLNPYRLIPVMPYGGGVLLALALLALTALLAAGCVYYGAFLRQLARAYGRFRRNALASASGEAVLPALAVNPRFSGKAKRRLRNTALAALTAFAVCFALAYAACALSAGSFQFWHAWGWFRN